MPPETVNMKPYDLLSMTGFGSAEVDVPQGRLRVEIRSVNHRFLNLQVRLPSGLDRLQPEIEARLKRGFSRGHISLNVSLDRSLASERAPMISVDLERARAYVDAFRTLQVELGVSGTVDVGTLAGFRDLFPASDRDRAPLPELDPEAILGLVDAAVAEVRSMRRTEGHRLGQDLARGLDRMEGELDAVAVLAPLRLLRERDRIRQVIRELMDGIGEVDEERVAREVAHLAERWDVHEELVRFRSHLALFRETLAIGSPEGVGKRFGFIAQELLREANTLGSKANDAEIQARVLVLKEEIERVREQLENVE
jgi:uncharacterized protein (TIGR00255 family)